MSSLRAALKDALVANLDDLAAHAAYADLLQEEGNPRGEFIQVQLALEDPRRSPEERESLRLREEELLQRHQREWLGEAAEALLGELSQEQLNERFGLEYTHASFAEFRFARGWINQLSLENFSPGFAAALGRSPTLGLLRELTITNNNYDATGHDELASWPGLEWLRRFQLGPVEPRCFIRGHDILPAVERMRRLEELFLCAHGVPIRDLFALPLPNLRTLYVHHIYDYPLEVLAANESLGNLVTLSCWPHALEPDHDCAYIQPGPFTELVRSPHLKSLTHLSVHLSDIGDEGVRALVESGLLRRLRVLDLSGGRITDEGARLLAGCPDLRHVEWLGLAQNQLTPAGIAGLQATGVQIECEGQFSPGSIEENAHLWEGDME